MLDRRGLNLYAAMQGQVEGFTSSRTAAMAFLVGTDEAGYGPNLGPLVISATVWHVPEETEEIDLYDLLAECVCRPSTGPQNGKAKPKGSTAHRPGSKRAAGGRTASNRSSCDRVALADSKALYKAGGSLELLERGVLAALASLGQRPDSWRALCSSLDEGCCDAHAVLPWHCEFDLALPVAQPVDDIDSAAERFAAGCTAAGGKCKTVRSRIVHPPDFNRLVQQHDSKGAVLTETTLQLLSEVLVELPDEPIYVVCDKHGGRNRYGQALQQAFPDYLVEIYGESRPESLYVCGPPERRLQVAFRTKGERFLPSALASMVSKYVRELCMRGFNDYWQQHVPGVKATAGYPQDARRFRREIADRQGELGIDDALLWRSR